MYYPTDIPLRCFKCFGVINYRHNRTQTYELPPYLFGYVHQYLRAILIGWHPKCP
jgi:hypothetical protein